MRWVSFDDGSAMGITLFRIGLASAGGLLLHLVFAIVSAAPLSLSPGDIFIMLACGVLGLFLLAAAGLRNPPDWLRWLILLACIGELAVHSVIWMQTSRLPNLAATDTALYTDMAGELLQQGKNPYDWDYTGTFELYRTSQVAITPKLNAAQESVFPYPALPFLLAVPLQAMGLPGSFWVSVLAHGAVLVTLFLASPPSFRPVILIPIVVGIEFTSLTLVGSLDIVWSAFLVGMVVAWRRPYLRAVLFGLALSFKQGPWLLLPFLIVYVWRTKGSVRPVVRVGRFLIVSALTFLIVNGYFILWDFPSWFQGVTEPLRDDLVLFSHGGLSSLSQLGFVHLPKSYYLIATLAALGLLLFYYWRHHDILRNALWIMPGIVMWFSYRSLVSYWAYWLFPILASWVSPVLADRGTENKGNWRLTGVITTVVLGSLLVLFLSSATWDAVVEVRPTLPLKTDHGRINRMRVQVANHSAQSLTPRFSVQHRYTGGNPLPWTIERGPLSLMPGQVATYQVYTHRYDRSFLAHDSAQLIVTDANGDYSLRGMAEIGPDLTFLWPDAIPNPDFLFWNRDQTVPIFWELVTDPLGAGQVLPVDEARWLALELTGDGASPSRVALQTWFAFPLEPFGIWLYPPPVSDSSTSVAYGLEIDDGGHLLWLLFGPQEYTGDLDGQYVLSHIVPAQKWVYQEIDVMAAYEEAGWQLPPPEPVVHRGLDTDLRLVRFSLFLATDEPGSDLQARFGPIEQDSLQVDPEILMAETFDHPANYYIRLAEHYVSGHNYARALEAYRHALEFSPENSLVLERIDQTETYLVQEGRE